MTNIVETATNGKRNKRNPNSLNLLSFSHISFILSMFIFITLVPFGHSASETNLPTGCEVALQLDFGNQSANNPIGVEQNWKSLSLIGILFSFSLISIIYLIGKTLDNPSLLARAKTDLVQVVVTLLILGVLYGIMSVFCLLDPNEFGISASSFFDAASKYFEYAESKALSAYLKAMNSVMLVSSLSSISVNAPAFIPLGNFVKIGLFARLFSGLSVTLGGLNLFASVVMLSISMMHGYLLVLNSIQTHLLNLFLPIGVVLRCFSPTRDLGGVFIALAIGLWFFYPLLFSFSYMMIGSPPDEPIPSLDWSTSIGIWIPVIAATSQLPFGPIVSWPLLLSGNLNEVIENYNDVYSSIGSTILSVFILPAINWIILVAIVRELSKALGQEVDISGLARMI